MSAWFEFCDLCLIWGWRVALTLTLLAGIGTLLFYVACFVFLGKKEMRWEWPPK